MKSLIKNTLLILVIILSVSLSAQEITKVEIKNKLLSNQFNEIFENKKTDNFWIGYSIYETDNRRICIGRTIVGDEFDLTFKDVINNTLKYRKYKSLSEDDLIKKLTNNRTYKIRGRTIDHKEGEKEVAILFRYDRNSVGHRDFAEIVICNFSFYTDLKEYPVYWLGNLSKDRSIKFLISEYNSSELKYNKEELISAIGIHSNDKRVAEILEEVYMTENDNELREDAVFWLGFQNSVTAFKLIKEIIEKDPSSEIREEAVMALGMLDLPEATDELIKIARYNKDEELREEAVIHLGSKAVEKAKLALKDFIDNDPNSEIKKHAIYALSENGDDNIEFLIKLAKSHENLNVRKHAIWALSSSESKLAVEALIDLVEN